MFGNATKATKPVVASFLPPLDAPRLSPPVNGAAINPPKTHTPPKTIAPTAIVRPQFVFPCGSCCLAG